MQKISKVISALVIAMAIQPLSYAEDKDRQVASVNGDPVMLSDLLTYAKVKNPQADLNNPAVRQQLIQAYIGRELLYQDALAQKLDQRPIVQVALENQRHEVISQALVAKIMQDKPVTDADARNYYDKELAGRKESEYKLRHILLKSEEDANKALERLNKGEDFAKLAQTVSVDTSAAQGGDLGWMTPGRMPAEFAEAVKGATVGKHAAKAVKTNFGWHIVKVEQTRPVQIPPYEQVKDQIKGHLTEMNVGNYIAELQKKAKIDINNGSN